MLLHVTPYIATFSHFTLETARAPCLLLLKVMLQGHRSTTASPTLGCVGNGGCFCLCKAVCVGEASGKKKREPQSEWCSTEGPPYLGIGPASSARATVLYQQHGYTVVWVCRWIVKGTDQARDDAGSELNRAPAGHETA